jgi:signal transduction histidine kinase
VQLGLSEIRLDARRLYIGIVRDITEEKRLDQMKDSFIAQVSHELRTPLTSLNAALSLMRGEGSPGEARRLVEIAHSSSARLTRLVTDILDYERLEAGDLPLHIDVTSLAPIVERAVEEERPRAETLGVTIAYGTPLPDARVLADPTRLCQAVNKLLDNAVRMSPRGERVLISVERRKNLLQIAVTDRGPGVPESFRSQVFSKFAQVESSDERYRTGAGLGLSLARAIVERHGGTIDFYSVPGVETKFFIEIPEVYDDPDAAE